ncbi:MAG: RNA-binding S4 domain-containing protein [Stellaceae bacterium]
MRGEETAPSTRRLDQWLWFARLVKTRSLASRLCAAGSVAVNGTPVDKANHPLRIGDVIAVEQGRYVRSIRVLAFGSRRGPASEARLMYEESAARVRLSEVVSAWVPLLAPDDP